MQNQQQDQREVSRRNFVLICLGGYFFSLAYGVTFLLPFMVVGRGGDEAFAGVVIATATLSTVLFVIFSGHLADRLGCVKSISVAGFLLASSMLGFFLSRGLGYDLMFYGLLLGAGWGLFYTLTPILVATVIKPKRRVRFLALLSGCMMAGIGTGPLVGRLAIFFALPVQTAFLVAGFFSVCGAVIYIGLGRIFGKNHNFIPQVSRISVRSVCRVLRSNAVFPIVMVGLGGCIFGGLSSFQTTYAQRFGFDYSLFFGGFTLTAVFCRLTLAGYIVKRDPFVFSFLLMSLTVISIVMFIYFTQHVLSYVLATVVLGVGYGLTYSVINGLAVNEAPEGLMPQSLLLFSLSYFVGIFGFPLLAGRMIVHTGVISMLWTLLAIALLNVAIAVFRLWQQGVLKTQMSRVGLRIGLMRHKRRTL